MEGKKTIPTLHPCRQNTFDEIAQRLFTVLDAEYELSALDFLQLVEHIKNTGLSRFHL